MPGPYPNYPQFRRPFEWPNYKLPSFQNTQTGQYLSFPGNRNVEQFGNQYGYLFPFNFNQRYQGLGESGVSRRNRAAYGGYGNVQDFQLPDYMRQVGLSFENLPPQLTLNDVNALSAPNLPGTYGRRKAALDKTNRLEKLGYPVPVPGSGVTYDPSMGTIGGLSMRAPVGDYFRWPSGDYGSNTPNINFGIPSTTGKSPTYHGPAGDYLGMGGADVSGIGSDPVQNAARVAASIASADTGWDSTCGAYGYSRDEWRQMRPEAKRAAKYEAYMWAQLKQNAPKIEALATDLERQGRGIANLGIYGPAGMAKIVQAGINPVREALPGQTNTILNRAQAAENALISGLGQSAIRQLGSRAVANPALANKALMDQVVQPSLARRHGLTSELLQKQYDTDNQLQLAIGDLVKENMASKVTGLEMLQNILGFRQGAMIAQQQFGMDMTQFNQSLDHDERMRRLQANWQATRDRMQHYYTMMQMYYGYQIQKDLKKRSWTDWVDWAVGLGTDIVTLGQGTGGEGGGTPPPE